VLDEILKLMRQNTLAGQIVMTSHAVREMKDEDLTLDDVINTILTGDIVKQQFDSILREYKYVIYGDTLSGNEACVVAKPGVNDTVVITVYKIGFDDYEQ
jgi:hypothetical protein